MQKLLLGLLLAIELDRAYFVSELPELRARSFFEELPVRHVQSHRYNCTLISPGNGSTIGGMVVFVDIRCTVKERCPPAEDCPHCYNMCKLLSQCLSTRIVISMDGQVSASAPPALAQTKSRCLAQRSTHATPHFNVITCWYHGVWDTTLRGLRDTMMRGIPCRLCAE